MPKLFDAVMFFQELEMLELRFNILNDVVDYFVVCEAQETHSGMPKPLNFLKHYDRFKPWHNRIIYLNAGRLSDHVQGNWERERYHRSCITKGLQDARSDDWVIVADCDEIPNPAVVSEIKYSDLQAAKLELDMFYYDMNHHARQGWAVGMYRKWVESDPNKIRTCAGYNPQPFLNAGWHFSWFNGPQAILDKQAAFMHSSDPGIRDMPRDPEWVAQRVKESRDLFDRPGFQIDRIPLSSTLPKYVLDNQDYYKGIGWILST